MSILGCHLFPSRVVSGRGILGSNKRNHGEEIVLYAGPQSSFLIMPYALTSFHGGAKESSRYALQQPPPQGNDTLANHMALRSSITRRLGKFAKALLANRTVTDAGWILLNLLSSYLFITAVKGKI